MNKIVIVDGEIVESQIDNSVKILATKKNEFLNVQSVKINIEKDTNLQIESESKTDSKVEFYINVLENIKCNIYEYKYGSKAKIGYKYYLAQNSKLNIYQINDIDEIAEMPLFNLNGENAELNFNIKTVSKKQEKYDILVYHNAKGTKSHVNNEGVNIKNGTLTFNVSAFIPKGIKECLANQKNRIINLTNNTCQIKPNLFIDENDVIANHSAHIGKCNDNELFYLMSRGITHSKAENLIIKGFLLKNTDVLKKNMERIINKYWR